MAVTMPTTSPSCVTSGPPELPGLAAASNWMRLESVRLPSGERNSRFRPDTTPDETDGPMPNGKPTATTRSPGMRSPVERMVAATRSSGMALARSTARSCSACTPTTRASDTRPSKNSTFTRSAPCTTCRLVRMVPFSWITTPEPTPRSSSSSWSLSVPMPYTFTTDGAMISAALRAGDGSGAFSRVLRVIASTSSTERKRGRRCIAPWVATSRSAASMPPANRNAPR